MNTPGRRSGGVATPERGRVAAATAWPRLLAGGLLLLALTGCGPRPPQAVRLVVISPHRDEIRQEFADGFRDWIRDRTTERLRRARAAAVHALGDPEADVSEPLTRALKDVWADWNERDLPAVASAWSVWQVKPSANAMGSLRSAIDEAIERPPEVELVWQDLGGGTGTIVRYVRSRFGQSPRGIGVDLLFGGGTDLYLRFAEEGLLQPLQFPPDLLGRIRPQLNGIPLYDPKGRWFGPMLSSFGILYNRNVLTRIGQPEPAHWADLGRPGLRSWVAAGDPRVTGSLHMVYEIILQGHGWDDGWGLLLRMAANTHDFIRDSGTLTSTVAHAAAAAAGNLDANALSAVAHDPDGMGYVLPAGETLINPDAMAVLKGAPRGRLARAFVEFCLSDAGQRLLLLRPGVEGGPRRYALGRLSVVEEFYKRYPPSERAVGTVNPFAVTNTIPYKSDVATARWDALNDLFGAWAVDAQPRLAAAWRAVLRAPEAERPRLEAKLFAPPCTEAALVEYAREVREGSPRRRTEAIARWGEEARRRYREVTRDARAATP
jgi:ABC-type Fe3+ transport system substrate-binding protein